MLVLRGVADGPTGITLDILGAATRLARTRMVDTRAELRPVLVSVDGRSVRSAAGRIIGVDAGLGEVRPTRRDVVIVPGLGFASEREVHEGLARNDVRRAAAWLGERGARAQMVGASCAATFLLAASGVLDGGEATTTWWLSSVFARTFPRITLRRDRMVVASAGWLTAGSAFAHADLMLAIVARALGPSVSHLAARYLVLDERASQARYMVPSQHRASDPAVLAVERAVLEDPSAPLTLATLSRRAHASPRTLARRFHAALGTTPLRFVQALRMERASHLLETTTETVEAIARQVGYADPSAFRRVFRRELGWSPRETRSAPHAPERRRAGKA